MHIFKYCDYDNDSFCHFWKKGILIKEIEAFLCCQVSSVFTCEFGRSRVKSAIIKGTKKYKWIGSNKEIRVDFNCKDKRIYQLMDDLYDIYRHDPTTINGHSMMPLIGMLKENPGTEFRIYFENGIVRGFIIFTFMEYINIKKAIPTITFAWFIPKCMGRGLFAEIYKNLVMENKGPVQVEFPNYGCKKALEKINYNDNEIFSFYNK